MEDSKTRNQSVLEYFEALQLEYIQAEIRRKIYPGKKDKSYWTKVLKFKKEKIEDISYRNGLPNIFNDDSILDSYRKIIIKDMGFPSFFYKNEDDFFDLNERDFRYYYRLGSDVKVLVDDDKIDVGKIAEEPDLDSDVVDVKIKGEAQSRKFYIKYVTRIL